jgi:hypothetical protein
MGDTGLLRAGHFLRPLLSFRILPILFRYLIRSTRLVNSSSTNADF